GDSFSWSVPSNKSFRERDEALDVLRVADHAERDADRARTLAVDAHAEIVEREMGFVLGLTETRRQLGPGDAERDLAAAGVAEAAVRSEMLARFAACSTRR